MTNEEKQSMPELTAQQKDDLIWDLNAAIEDISAELSYENESTIAGSIRLSGLYFQLIVSRIALAALTAQPVKLPDVRIFCNSNKSHRKVIYAVTDAIHAAGYEVRE